MTRKEGAIGFVDDYTAWVTGASAKENAQQLQQTIIPRVEQWARYSQATFGAEKTGYIHFIPPKREQEQPRSTLTFQGQTIHSQLVVKLLGVHLDSKLKMHTHIQAITAAATKQALALTRLRGMRPRQIRQLYTSTVTPIMDYAASTWYSLQRWGTLQHLYAFDKVQRIGAQAITRAFKTVALSVLEGEAGLETAQTRLHRKVTRHLLQMLTLPRDHPLLSHLLTVKKPSKGYRSALLQTWSQLPKTVIKKADTVRTETVWPAPPWGFKAQLQFSSLSEEQALALEGYQNAIVYCTAAAQRRDQLRIAVVQKQGRALESFGETVGSAQDFSLRWGEVLAVCRAIQSALVCFPNRLVTIILYSEAAFQYLSRAYSGQQHGSIATLVRATLRPLTSRVWINISYTPRNDQRDTCIAAYEEANSVTGLDTMPSWPYKLYEEGIECQQLQPLLKRALNQAANTVARDRTAGQYTWQMDQSLPSLHTKSLYGALSTEEASLLIQCRTNHSHLRSYLYRIKASETDQCDCGQDQETIKHVIFACPLWRVQRQKARTQVGPRWVDLSYVLGGWSPTRDPTTKKLVHGPKEKWKANIKVVKTTLEFLASTGRFVAEP